MTKRQACPANGKSAGRSLVREETFLMKTIADDESLTVKVIADWKQRLSAPLKSV